MMMMSHVKVIVRNSGWFIAWLVGVMTLALVFQSSFENCSMSRIRSMLILISVMRCLLNPLVNFTITSGKYMDNKSHKSKISSRQRYQHEHYNSNVKKRRFINTETLGLLSKLSIHPITCISRHKCIPQQGVTCTISWMSNVASPVTAESKCV